MASGGQRDLKKNRDLDAMAKLCACLYITLEDNIPIGFVDKGTPGFLLSRGQDRTKLAVQLKVVLLEPRMEAVRAESLDGGKRLDGRTSRVAPTLRSRLILFGQG